VKNERSLILEENEKELYAYIGGIIKQTQSFPIQINGVANHIHILSTFSKNISLADFIKKIKGNSSRWIKTKGVHYDNFEWQGGYSGYSVSQSKVETIKKYIENQKRHHEKVSFREEYHAFLKEYEVDFNESFLWT
jgi:REP element-mobilizing transposase RayT